MRASSGTAPTGTARAVRARPGATGAGHRAEPRLVSGSPLAALWVVRVEQAAQELLDAPLVLFGLSAGLQVRAEREAVEGDPQLAGSVVDVISRSPFSLEPDVLAVATMAAGARSLRSMATLNRGRARASRQWGTCSL